MSPEQYGIQILQQLSVLENLFRVNEFQCNFFNVVSKFQLFSFGFSRGLFNWPWNASARSWLELRSQSPGSWAIATYATVQQGACIQLWCSGASAEVLKPERATTSWVVMVFHCQKGETLVLGLTSGHVLHPLMHQLWK